MAAARVRGGSGGTSGYAVALVIFVILFVLALLGSIAFYTQWSGVQQELEKVKKDKLKYVTDTQDSTDARLAGMKGAALSDTIVGTLLTSNDKLKNYIIGDAAADTSAVDAQIKELGLAEGQKLTQVIKALRDEKAAKDTDLERVNKELEEARTQWKQTETLRASGLAAFRKTEETLKQELTQIKGQHAAYTEEVNTQFKTLQDRITEIETAKQAATTDLAGKIEKLSRDNAVLRKRNEELQKPVLKGDVRIDPSILPDGKIISIIPEENVVFIDRGRKDHLVLGMTFEVFPRNTLPTKNEYNEMHGKATIEVVDMSDNASRCRIVRMSRGVTVTEADIIANAIYDPNVVLKFFVFGDFDLDRTGVASSSERKRIEAMITEWGGKVADDFSYDVDVLILGVETKMPDPLPKDETNAEVISAYEAAKKKYLDYQMYIGRANQLRIAILNQNRFMLLVGYYQRMPRAVEGPVRPQLIK